MNKPAIGQIRHHNLNRDKMGDKLVWKINSGVLYFQLSLKSIKLDLVTISNSYWMVLQRACSSNFL